MCIIKTPFSYLQGKGMFSHGGKGIKNFTNTNKKICIFYLIILIVNSYKKV